jgi:hypothetical protein
MPWTKREKTFLGKAVKVYYYPLLSKLGIFES